MPAYTVSNNIDVVTAKPARHMNNSNCKQLCNLFTATVFTATEILLKRYSLIETVSSSSHAETENIL